MFAFPDLFNSHYIAYNMTTQFGMYCRFFKLILNMYIMFYFNEYVTVNASCRYQSASLYMHCGCMYYVTVFVLC